MKLKDADQNAHGPKLNSLQIIPNREVLKGMMRRTVTADRQVRVKSQMSLPKMNNFPYVVSLLGLMPIVLV